jgi:hypothetical protein
MHACMTDGDRVRIIKGYKSDSSQEAPYQLWCGGKVPVGAIGTIRRVHEGMMRIDFDKHTPRDGFYFGLSVCLPNWLEWVET